MKVNTGFLCFNSEWYPVLSDINYALYQIIHNKISEWCASYQGYDGVIRLASHNRTSSSVSVCSYKGRTTIFIYAVTNTGKNFNMPYRIIDLCEPDCIDMLVGCLQHIMQAPHDVLV